MGYRGHGGAIWSRDRKNGRIEAKHGGIVIPLPLFKITPVSLDPVNNLLHAQYPIM